MLQPFGAVGKRAPVSHQRLGIEHLEIVAFQLGMAVAQKAPPVVREPVRMMAGLSAASGTGGGVVGGELAVARWMLPGAAIF
jgi:hypothetical protein